MDRSQAGDDVALATKRFRRAVTETYEVLAKMGYGDREGLDELGALKMARRLLRDSTTSRGFTRLWEMGRLGLSVEALVLRPEFRILFTDEERAIAIARLSDRGFFVEV
jgi:hypothetical protein